MERVSGCDRRTRSGNHISMKEWNVLLICSWYEGKKDIMLATVVIIPKRKDILLTIR
jgi:hypothetical protein